MSALRIALLLLVCLSASPLFADWTYEVTGGKEDVHPALVSLSLPAKTQAAIQSRKLRVFAVDARKIARERTRKSGN